MEILELAQELAEVTRLVDNDDIGKSFQRYVNRLVATVPNCQYAVISILSGDLVKTLAHTGNPGIGYFDDQPRSAGELGPIGETLRYAEPRRMADVEQETRWPLFDAGLIESGYRSCICLPLHATTTDEGATLTLFSQDANAFDDTTFDLALLFALNAGAVFDNLQLYQHSQQLIEQLRTALQSQRVIGQAQGLLMRAFDIAADDAFEMLKRASQNRNVKLRLVAAELIERHGRTGSSVLPDLGY